jgi:uncharacterized HhH-GPD family protein
VTLYLTPDPVANQLLVEDPFALIVGMLLDQQIPMERAFGAPKLLDERLRDRGHHGLTPATVAQLPEEELAELFAAKPALHRFPRAMAAKVQALARTIEHSYGGDTAALWRTAATGEELVARLRALDGFGADKAKIFAALIAKRLGVRPPGWEGATAPFGQPGTYMSVADSVDPEALERVRAHKAQMKQASKN